MFQSVKRDAGVAGMGFPTNRRNRRMTTPCTIVFVTAFAASIIYGIYAAITQTGLAGYVIKLQMDVLGHSEDSLTLGLTTVPLMMSILCLLGIGEKIAPAWVWVSGDRQRGYDLARMSQQPVRITWKWVWIITALPIVAGLVLYGVWSYTDRQDSHRKIYSVRLTSDAPVLPKEAKFVEVSGVMARRYALQYKKTENDNVTFQLYAPITAPGWTPNQPVRYVVRHDARQAFEGDVSWPRVFEQPGIAEFSGIVGGSLPAFVESRFRSKGVRLASSCFLIDWQDLPNHQIPSSFDNETRILTLAIAAVTSLMVFAGTAGLKAAMAWQSRRLNRN